MWRYFTEAELACKCGCGRCEMDEEFMADLDDLREVCGFPFPVTSGYRFESPDEKESSSTTPGRGPHTTGKAVDIAANARRKFKILEIADGITGIGIAKTFIHLDTLTPEERPSRPCVFTY